MKKVISIIFALSLLLIACGGGAEPEPTATPVPPTETPVPPTATPEPTEEPMEEPTEEPMEEEMEPTAEPEEESETAAPSGDFTELISDGGFIINYPSSWEQFEMFGLAMLASDPALLEQMEGDAPMPEDGAIVMVIGSEMSEMGDDPISALETMANDIGPGEDVTVVDGPTAVTINGQEGAVMTVTGSEGEQEIFARMAILTSEGRAVTVMAITPLGQEDQYESQIEAIINSVQVTESTLEDAFGGDVGGGEIMAAGAVAIDETMSGNLDDGDSDGEGWTFTGTADQTISVVAMPTAEDLDIVMDIQDADGNSILGGEEDVGFSGEEETATVTLPADGEYTIVVRPFALGTGDYELTVTEGEPVATGPGEDLGGGGVIAIGETGQGTLTDSEGEEAWSLMASEGDELTFTLTPLDDDFDIVMAVLGPNGDPVTSGDEVDDGFSGEPETATVTIPSDGDYSVVVRGFAGDTGSYELSIAGSEGAMDGGESMATGPVEITAGTLAYGESVSGDIGSDTMTVTWGFTGSGGDVIDADVVPADDLDVVVRVRNAATGEVVSTADRFFAGVQESVRFAVLPEDGEYVLEISGDASTGSYDATLLDASGGVTSSVLVLEDEYMENGEPISYPFDAVAGDMVRATVDPLVDELDVVISIIDFNTEEEFESVDASFGFEELSYEIPEDGTYAILVSGFAGVEAETGEYDIVLYGTSGVNLTMLGGDTIVGFLRQGGEVRHDFFGYAGETATFTVNPDAEVDVVLTVYDASGEIIDTVDASASGGAETYSYTFEEDQAIDVVVAEYFSNSGDFILEVAVDTAE